MIEIYLASRKDIPTIQEIANRTWFDTYATILSDQQCDYMFEMMYSSRSLVKQMEEGHVFYIALYNGKPSGYVSIRREMENLFHLEKLYVTPDCQGLSIGKELIEKAFAFAKENSDGGCSVELNVNRNNKAVEFYEKMGMHKDREGDFPIGNDFFMNDYIMKIDL